MIKIINYNEFYSNLSKEWKNIFLEEYNLYWKNFTLYWFYNNEYYLWWFCIWYNPDYCDNMSDKNIIDDILNKNYIKISYFSILDKYRWKKMWGKYLLDFLKKNNKSYFLTCNWEKLKEYYVSLWFRVINKNKNKHILIFN